MNRRLSLHRRFRRALVSAACCAIATCALLPGPPALAACYNWYPPTAKAGLPVPLEIRDVHLADAQNGWAAGSQRILRSSDAGRSWSDVTPTFADPVVLEATHLRDAQDAWVVAATHTGDRTLAHTRDAGASWGRSTLPPLGERAPVALHFVDANDGWLLLRRPSSSNFQFGSLLRTRDGGATWNALPAPPVVGKLAFVSADVGWLAGGVQGDRLYLTTDGGTTWRRQVFPGIDDDARLRVPVPRFRGAREGTLALVAGRGSSAQLRVFASDDGGRSWRSAAALPADSDDARVPAFAAPDAQTLVLAPRADDLALRTGNASWRHETPASPALRPGGTIAALEFSSADRGWLLQQSGVCTAQKDNCHQETHLLLTEDGARSFTEITPLTAAAASPPQPDAVSTSVHHCGFDQCAAGSVAQMQAWWTNTPWSDANIYLGGENSACDVANDARLKPSWFKAVFAQGWHLIPTWVGKQAPTSICSGCSKLSTNAVTARTQGIAEADAAVAKARSVGLQLPSVIYYDMEGYTEPNAPTAAFLDGWTQRLHELGITSGIYGGASEASADWYPLANRADAVWIARWYNDPLDFPGTVFDIPGTLGNDKWANNQRIRQFHGGHDETWGGVTFNIDRNYEDAPVAAYDCLFCDGFDILP